MKLRFLAKANTTHGSSDAWPVDEGDFLPEVLKEAVLDAMDIHIDVTIAGVTMFLAAWLDPDHWATDWAEKIGCDYDDVDDRVTELLQGGLEA